MKKFIEVPLINTDGCENITVMDLNTVSNIYTNNGKYIIEFEDGEHMFASRSGYKILHDALLNDNLYKSNSNDEKVSSHIEDLKESRNIADKLCELQHDHTWIKQAVCNLIAMMGKDNTSYKPALLIGCNDKDLDTLFSDCYNKVRKMQGHINSLEKQVKTITEPKKGK